MISPPKPLLLRCARWGVCVFLTLQFSISMASEPEAQHICGPFYVHVEKKFFFKDFTLNENERILICGADAPGWDTIPEGQALEMLKNFLKARAYFNFEITRKDGKIFVEPGAKSEIKDIQFFNKPAHFDDRIFLGIQDKLLNTNNLDTLESWSLSRLRTIGYPCPDLDMIADPKTGRVEVTLMPGDRVRIEEIERTDLPGVWPSALSRFDAFEIGDFYNDELLALTSRRAILSGLVDYSSFQAACFSEDYKKGKIEQNLIYGEPRFLLVSFGATTEEYPIAKFNWRNTRMDAMASIWSSELYLSSVRQTIESDLRWYAFPDLPRLYFLPRAEVTRQSEDIYESLTQKLVGGIGYSADDSNYRYNVQFKPSYNVENTFRGEGPGHASFVAFETEVGLVSHLFEFFQTSPRLGHQFKFSWLTQRQGLGSSLNGDLYQLGGTVLYNWGRFDPPLVVFGFRFRLASLQTSALQDAPASYRLYLGGNEDLRGFGRKSINNGGLGYSSLGYLGTEVRFVQILPFNMQPFALVDFAKVAQNGYEFMPAVLWSPGAGLRWQSPIGAFRATAAYGSVENGRPNQLGVSEGWTYFLSFGQEF